MTFSQELIEVFSKYDLQVNQLQAEKFEKYFNLITEWNEKFNLTAILEQSDVIVKHFLDSCLMCKGLKQSSKLIDVGSGAGFPGIPIKIMRDDIDVLLIDGSNKRITFLNEIISSLELNNISAIHTRCEDMAHNADYREKFDYAVARAVAPTNVLAEYCLPFVKLYGNMICYKSKNAEAELELAKSSLELLGGRVCEIKNVLINEIDAERNLVFIQKKFKTPLKFPRNQNKPRISPL